MKSGTDNGFRARGVELTCGRCQRALVVDLVVVADTATEPELLAQVAEGGLNRFECPTCHHRFGAPTPVLFHDANRRRALVFVPAALGDPEPLVNGLLSRYLRGAGEAMPGDYLLEPTIYRDTDEFAAALAGAGDLAAGGVLHPRLSDAADWCRERGEANPARLLDALSDVCDLPQLLAALNETPELVDPAALHQLEHLAAEAEQDRAPELAEVLRDVAAMLRLHTPEPDEDEETAELRDQLAAGDVEAAAEFLEPPEREGDEEFERAMLNALEPDEREGFTEHARLFGHLVDEMIRSVTPESLDEADSPPMAEALTIEGLEELFAADTLDAAMDVLGRYPALVSREAVLQLRRAEARAHDLGHEAVANHLSMLVHTIYIAAEDEDALDDEVDDELDQ